jgi:hypothetical protein
MPKRTCHHCGQAIEIPDSAVGENFPCPLCGKDIMMPPDNILHREKIRLSVSQPVVENFAAPDMAGIARRIIANIQTVIVGKEPQVTLAVAGLFAEGHILFEDVPGVAKTMLSRAIAQSIGCSFKRIQCTPDLSPDNVIGDFVPNPTTGNRISASVRCFRRWCWWTKSTAPARARRPRCWRRWAKAWSRWTRFPTGWKNRSC